MCKLCAPPAPRTKAPVGPMLQPACRPGRPPGCLVRPVLWLGPRRLRVSAAPATQNLTFLLIGMHREAWLPAATHLLPCGQGHTGTRRMAPHSLAPLAPALRCAAAAPPALLLPLLLSLPLMWLPLPSLACTAPSPLNSCLSLSSHRPCRRPGQPHLCPLPQRFSLTVLVRGHGPALHPRPHRAGGCTGTWLASLQGAKVHAA